MLDLWSKKDSQHKRSLPSLGEMKRKSKKRGGAWAGKELDKRNANPLGVRHFDGITSALTLFSVTLLKGLGTGGGKSERGEGSRADGRIRRMLLVYLRVGERAEWIQRVSSSYSRKKRREKYTAKSCSTGEGGNKERGGKKSRRSQRGPGGTRGGRRVWEGRVVCCRYAKATTPQDHEPGRGGDMY